jgi:ABC-type proline/glycine betaine transport system substrate-binding protein
MSFAAALILAAAMAASAAAPAPPVGDAGVQLASAQARAAIVQAAMVRQDSGLEEDPDAPTPQISRRGITVLIEFE